MSTQTQRDGDRSRRGSQAQLDSAHSRAAAAGGDPLMTLSDPLGLRHETVVVPVTVLEPAPDTTSRVFARANEIYRDNHVNIRIKVGTRLTLRPKKARKLIGSDDELDDGQEQKKLFKKNRSRGRVSAYWVSDIADAPNWTTSGYFDADKNAIAYDANHDNQDTFAHEVGHALGLAHNNSSSKNLMADGDHRDKTGAPDTDRVGIIEKLKMHQSHFLESHRKQKKR